MLCGGGASPMSVVLRCLDGFNFIFLSNREKNKYPSPRERMFPCMSKANASETGEGQSFITSPTAATKIKFSALVSSPEKQERGTTDRRCYGFHKH